MNAIFLALTLIATCLAPLNSDAKSFGGGGFRSSSSISRSGFSYKPQRTEIVRAPAYRAPAPSYSPPPTVEHHYYGSPGGGGGNGLLYGLLGYELGQSSAHAAAQAPVVVQAQPAQDAAQAAPTAPQGQWVPVTPPAPQAEPESHWFRTLLLLLGAGLVGGCIVYFFLRPKRIE